VKAAFSPALHAPVLLALAALLSGCEGSQAVLAPRGPHAEVTAWLAGLLFAGGTLVLLGVVLAIVFAVRGSPSARAFLAQDRTIVAAGAGLPIVTLSALLAYGLHSTADPARAAPAALAIEVVGEQWWWRIRYLDESGRWDFVTANEIRVPTGAQVELRLASADVIHSFWVPSLAGKLDMVPGRVNRLRIQADEAGVYRGQCAEYCGGAHALMAFHVVAEAPAEFEVWRERQRRPAAEPTEPEAQRGREVFLANGCALCHRVAGTPAAGTIGPDLTHVGGRLHLMSGLLRSHRGTFAGWIASAQRLKPENRMPSYTRLAGADLRALAAWLESLE
jgi:cytochrome c oxidase subunit 2